MASISPEMDYPTLAKHAKLGAPVKLTCIRDRDKVHTGKLLNDEAGIFFVTSEDAPKGSAPYEIPPGINGWWILVRHPSHNRYYGYDHLIEQMNSTGTETIEVLPVTPFQVLHLH